MARFAAFFAMSRVPGGCSPGLRREFARTPALKMGVRSLIKRILFEKLDLSLGEFNTGFHG
jgi:hypothetical protein